MNPSGHPLQGPPSGEYVPENESDIINQFILVMQREKCIDGKLSIYSGILSIPRPCYVFTGFLTNKE